VNDFEGVSVEKVEAELGLITGECGVGVAVRDALDPGDEGARRGGVSRSHKEENAAGEISEDSLGGRD
jgi:hypothetical protein